MSNHLDYEINKELGECYLFMGELDKAEEYYKKAAGSNGVHPDPYLGLATIAVQRGELDSAFRLYQKAANIEEDDKSLSGMGLIAIEHGNYEDSYEYFTRALVRNPENMIALTGLVQVGYVLKRVEDILPFMSNSLELDPDKAAVRFSLAGCLISLGRQQEAVPHLEAILEKDPGHEGARELYAQIS